MIKVLIDATPIQPNPSGVGLYVLNLIDQLVRFQASGNQNDFNFAKNDFDFGICYQPGFKKWLTGNFLPASLNLEGLNAEKSNPENIQKYQLPKNQNVYSLPIPVRLCKPLLLNSPSLLAFGAELFLNSPHIIHGTNYSVYPLKRSLKILNIYDLTFIKYPQYVDAVVAEYPKIVKKCLTWTDLVITISESVKQDIVEHLGVDPSKIHVTPLASRYDSDFLNKINPLLVASSFREYDFSKPYLLFVSTIEPRKNINALISAFNLLKQKYKIPHNLVLIGQKGWSYKPIFAAMADSPYRQDIYHLDYLTDELVAMFYARADVFVYPSHYEGFGLPILEAMIFDAPVVTSNVSSMPEVAGDAAVLVDPNNPEQLAEGILKVISDRAFRQDLIVRGRARTKLFAWEKTALETIKAYEKVLR